MHNSVSWNTFSFCTHKLTYLKWQPKLSEKVFADTSICLVSLKGKVKKKKQTLKKLRFIMEIYVSKTH